MLEIFKRWHLDLAIAALVLIQLMFGKWAEWRFRKRAVRVKGEVLKTFPHRHFTSYFVRYEYREVSRVAEYCGLPLVREFRPGDAIELLVDGSAPPNVPVPEDWHNAPGAHTGNSRRPDSPFVSFMDFVYVGVAVYLIAQHCMRGAS